MNLPRPVPSAMCVLLLVGCVGCADPSDIDARYGRRNGLDGGASVNGTAILAAMFEQAGHRVMTWRRLSPRLEGADTIVWAPDDFGPPSADCRAYLEKWLQRRPGRTLVYIGRDFDAAHEYWRQMQALAPPEQAFEVARRAAQSQAEYDARRIAASDAEAVGWFAQQVLRPPRAAGALSGPWAGAVESARTNIVIGTRFAPPPQATAGNLTRQVLLASDSDMLVGRLTAPEWRGSKLIAVVNGSFLLNLPLVNHEHRKLASLLVAECGRSQRTVFLESGSTGLPILDKEPIAQQPTGFEVLVTWPLGPIIMHVTVLGLVACFAFFPIFGRPREKPIWRAPTEQDRITDFGLHLEALAGMLEQTKNPSFAADQIQAYRHISRSTTPSLPTATPSNSNPEARLP